MILSILIGKNLNNQIEYSYEEICNNILRIVYSIWATAQSKLGSPTTKVTKDSTLIKIHDLLEDVDFRMHGLDRYKLYPTEIGRAHV